MCLSSRAWPAEPATTPPTPNATDRQTDSADQFQAEQLLKRAQAILILGETERAVRMLETVIEQHPGTPAGFNACLTLGRHYLQAGGGEAKALAWLARLNDLKPADGPVPIKFREIYLEGLYLTGKAHFQVHNYGGSCAVLRKITEGYPDTPWANQAHYTIGMCHFAQKRWADAIRSLSLVGTFVGEGEDDIRRVEAGRRLFVKIEDGDLPVLRRLGKPVMVGIKTAKGDAETVTCLPLGGGNSALNSQASAMPEYSAGTSAQAGMAATKTAVAAMAPGSTQPDAQASGPAAKQELITDAGQTIYVGSIPTAIGRASPGDGTLQLLGGDEITVTYVDAATEDGGRNMPRTSTVRVVSSATLAFTNGAYRAEVSASFLGQPAFVTLFDEDLDVSPAADNVTVRVQSRYKTATPGGAFSAGGLATDGPAAAADDASPKESQYVVRDEVTVTLAELRQPPATESGQPTSAPDEPDLSVPVHTGRFAGLVRLASAGSLRRGDGDGGSSTGGEVQPGEPESGEPVLACAIGDEIVAIYIDDQHIESDSPRRVLASVGVIGQLDSRPQATQDEVADPVILARKLLVEATAFLELARIFADMGLSDGAAGKADEGLTRVEAIIKQQRQIPDELKQDAHRLKWELYIARGDMNNAVSVCRTFNRLWPDSPLVDQALMSIARVRMAEKDYRAATTLLRQVLTLSKSQAKAEAQFLIAQSAEALASADPRSTKVAIEQYRLCAQRHPDSQYAGPALAKLVQHHIDNKDYAQASDLLAQIFRDHPDADFLDAMLLKWAELALRTGDYATARQKCEQLIFSYPGSEHARKAREVYLPEATQGLGAASPAAGQQDDNDTNSADSKATGEK